MEKLDDKNLEMVVTLARRIWLRRNSLVYGGDLTPPF
jgi:hypothetical protein